MQRRIVNPWTWQDAFGFVQANEISGGQHVLMCAGQLSLGPNEEMLHVGDLRGQVNQALDNVETVLTEAGYTLTDVVRLNYYTTDVDGLLAVYDAITDRLAAANCRCASTLLGVQRLAFPEMMIEIEATAVK